MAPTTRQCEYAGCEEVFVIDNLETYLGLLRIHVDAKHKPAPRTSAKAEKARRPELTLDTSEEGWSYFKARFDQYKKATGLEGDEVVTQLLECCSEAVRVDHHRTYSGLGGTRDEKTVLKELRSIAVKKQNIAVNRIHVGPDTLSRKEVSVAMVAMLGDHSNKELTGDDGMEATIEATVAANTPSPTATGVTVQ